MSDITFQVENWFSCRKKMEWLFPIHWEEVGVYKDKIKLNFNDEEYNRLAEQGNLVIVTARDKEKVVGYHWSFLKNHIRYQDSLTATTDGFFLHPDYRKGFNGINLFKFVEKTLKDMGVERMVTGFKTSHDKSKIFEYLNWDRQEIIYTKYIGE